MASKVKKPKAVYKPVQVVRLPVADLHPAAYNARTITDVALAGLGESLKRFGVLAPPVVNKRADGTYRLIGGHQRVDALKTEGAQEVDCVVVEFDDAQEQRANFALNNPAIEGVFVPELTRELLDRITAATGGDAAKLYSDLRFDQLYKDVLRMQSSDAGVDDVVQEGRTIDDEDVALGKTKCESKAGVFYKLGDHRLYCGKLAEVGTLAGFGVAAADMGCTRLVSSATFTDDFLAVHLGHLLKNTDGAVYVTTSTERLPQVHEAFVHHGGHWSNTLICFEPEAKGRKDVAYRDVVIPTLYGWRKGAMRLFFGDRTQSNAWHLKKAPPKDDVPVDVLIRHILNSTKKDAIVLDMLAGTGTTLIAGQKTGRRVIGYVATPREMDRVRRRWTRFVHGPEANWKTLTAAL